MSRLFRHWMMAFFDELWRLIPVQPILFPFFLVAGVLSIIYPPPDPALSWVWTGMNIASPLLVFLAGWLIFHKRGFLRYWGLWIRTAGDCCQAIGITVGILVWWAVLPIPIIVILIGLVVYLLVLVFRDLAALWLVEKVATNLYRDVYCDFVAR